MGRPSGRQLAFLALAAASWGIGTVASKQAVAEVPPLTLLVVQLATSLLFLGIVLLVRREPLATDRNTILLGRLGLLNPGLAYALSLIGLTGITASLSVLLWAGEPILILVLAVLVLRERARASLIVGTVAAVAGLALVVSDPAGGGSAIGIALTIGGVVACAVYTVLTRRLLLGSDSTFSVVVTQQLHALALAVLVVLALALAGEAVLPSAVTPGGLTSALVSGILYYGLAYSFYLTALRGVPASVAAMSFYLVPVFGIAGAWVTGERLEPLQWLGAAVVVGSVALVTTRSAPGDSLPAPTPQAT